jgi:hypothetical protein
VRETRCKRKENVCVFVCIITCVFVSEKMCLIELRMRMCVCVC